MELILTSFGFTEQMGATEKRSVFYRMPPITMSREFGYGFVLDVSSLLMCERVIVDKQSFDRLQSDAHPAYDNVAEMLKVLFEEGFVKLEDFEHIITTHSTLLDEMLKRDLRHLNDWLKVFKQSLQCWKTFTDQTRNAIYEHRNLYSNIKGDLSEEEEKELIDALNFAHVIGSMGAFAYAEYDLLEDALASPIRNRNPKHHQILRETIERYLSYVNANLVISNVLGSGFHDWDDLNPFYREKFLTVGKSQIPGDREAGEIRKLFEVSFPEFRNWDVKGVVKALKDSRIKDLRVLVQGAVDGEIEFDLEFARKTLLDVLNIEQRISRIRNVVSYAVTPTSFVPWVGTVLEKGIDEATGKIIEQRFKKNYKWFYLISELSIKN